MAIVLPVMLMLLFTYIFGNAIDPSGGYVDYVVPGIILLCAGFGSASTAVSVANDMTTGIIDRFRTMPLRSGAVLTGHVVASLVRNLVATAVVILVALLVGFRPTATPIEWVGVFVLVALWILAITYLFAAIGLAASHPRGGERLRVHPALPAVPVERLRAGRHDARLAAVDRREPADHAHHRDPQVTAHGHADGRLRMVGRRLVRS